MELLPSPCWNQSCGVPAQPIVGQCRWKQPCASRHASIIRPVMTRSQTAQTRWSSSEFHFRCESLSRNAMSFSSRLRRLFLMDLSIHFALRSRTGCLMRSKFVTRLESKRSVRKLWGPPRSLARQRGLGVPIWPTRDQIPLRQRTIHLQDYFTRRTAHKNNRWTLKTSGDQTEEMGYINPRRRKSPRLPPEERSIISIVNLSRQTSHASSTP